LGGGGNAYGDAGGVALGKKEETDDPEKVAELLSEALETFQELATLAEARGNSLVAARAGDSPLSVHYLASTSPPTILMTIFACCSHVAT
jgi:hypothetical protein